MCGDQRENLYITLQILSIFIFDLSSPTWTWRLLISQGRPLNELQVATYLSLPNCRIATTLNHVHCFFTWFLRVQLWFLYLLSYQPNYTNQIISPSHKRYFSEKKHSKCVSFVLVDVFQSTRRCNFRLWWTHIGIFVSVAFAPT